MRTVIYEFGQAMDDKMAASGHSGWEETTIEYLERRLCEEMAEYLSVRAGFHVGTPTGELLDIANFCMMLWSVYKEYPRELLSN